MKKKMRFGLGLSRKYDQYNIDILIPGYAERKCSEDGFWMAEDGEEAMDPSW